MNMSEQFNPLEKAKSSRTFCILPWIHQYVGPPGDVKPCCVYEHKQQLGSLKENTLKEIWNNDATKEMRLKFLNGEEDPNCGRCNSRVELEAEFKNKFNDDFFKKSPANQAIVAATNPDGSLDEHKLIYMDVRFNNLCNLGCRSCGPHFSTSWIVDSRKLYNKKVKEGIDDEFPFPGKTEEQALEEMLPHLPTMQSIYFAGGEPMMQKEHYEVLNKLVEVGNSKCAIRYNTNFSTFKLGKHDVIEYWKGIKDINVNASLDGNHAKAEYWRHGTVWADVVANRERMMKEVPHVRFNVGFTLSWPNAFNLIEFHREWVELGYIHPDNILVNVLDGPSYYSLKNIPDWKKEKIETAFRDQIAWLQERGCSRQTVFMYETAINFMWQERAIETYKITNVHDSLKNFSRITKKLDSIRKQDFWTTFPEHDDIRQYMTEHDLHDEFDY
jgi:organic radical activating enzyme